MLIIKLHLICFNSKRCDYEANTYAWVITKQNTVSIPKGAIMRSNNRKTIRGASLFQFQKVRLWAHVGIVAHLAPILFQFQKVRLWAFCISIRAMSYVSFQFQKVRLWASVFLTSNGVRVCVSIPKGAIMRGIVIFFAIFNGVSIPKGAIMRAC